MVYQWEDQKSVSNKEKHGFDFDEASQVFEEPFLLIFNSKYQTPNEARFVAIGSMTRKEMALLAVIFTLRAGAVRIISAHKPKKSYQKLYHNRLYVSSN